MSKRVKRKYLFLEENQVEHQQAVFEPIILQGEENIELFSKKSVDEQIIEVPDKYEEMVDEVEMKEGSM